MIDVYYTVNKDGNGYIIWWVEKTFFNTEGYVNDDEEDKDYKAISRALISIGCDMICEAGSDLLIPEQEMVDKMLTKGFNMIRNDDIWDEDEEEDDDEFEGNPEDEDACFENLIRCKTIDIVCGNGDTLTVKS